MTKPLFSVIIPAYNAGKTLIDAVQSVIGQTIQDFEIIIVDDGSKDNTVEVAQSIEDLRVVVTSQENGGASAARNTGIKMATGKYVAFLDADDLWVPHKLERQLAVFNSKENVTAVQSGVYFVNNSLDILSVRPCFESKDILLETLLFQNLPGLMSTLVVKRDIFEEIGYFATDLEIVEDWEFAIRLSRYCNFKSVTTPLALYRQFQGNRSKDLSSHIKPGHLILERLFNDSTLPQSIKEKQNLIYSTFFRMLCGGAFNVGRYAESVKWGLKSLIIYPQSLGYMLSLPLRRLQRNSSREAVSEKQQEIINQLKHLNSIRKTVK